MRIAAFETEKMTELWQAFDENVTVKETEYGLFIETYGKIDSETQMGSCHYGQAYPKGVSVAEAKKRFVDFYWPMNLADNGLQA